LVCGLKWSPPHELGEKKKSVWFRIFWHTLLGILILHATSFLYVLPFLFASTCGDKDDKHLSSSVSNNCPQKLNCIVGRGIRIQSPHVRVVATTRLSPSGDSRLIYFLLFIFSPLSLSHPATSNRDNTMSTLMSLHTFMWSFPWHIIVL